MEVRRDKERESRSILHTDRGKTSEVGTNYGADSRDIAPVINKWVAACFPQGSQSSEKDLQELVQEAADAARDDYDWKSAVVWTEGY